jgi:uncharacterized membrane protein YhaH (DUF805 family)
MIMIEYYKKVMNNYANFEGRARRSEYWYFALMNFLIVLALELVGFLLAFATQSPAIAVMFGILVIIYALAIIVPSIAVMVRRLHDVGKSGWWYFIAFVPLVGGIWLLVLMCTDSESGSNIYGPNPKHGLTDRINAA